MKTRSKKSPLRAGLKNVTNIKGNGRITKTKTAARCVKSVPAQEETEKRSSPLKLSDSHATPQKVFKKVDKSSIVNTPRTPSSVFQAAKSAFRRCSTPAKLIGRTEEREAIEAFIQHHVLEARPGSLYISGCPGTGKTALLTEVCTNLAQKFQKVHLWYNNSVSSYSHADLYKLHECVNLQGNLYGNSVSDGSNDQNFKKS
jgi:cell division control protein 6